MKFKKGDKVLYYKVDAYFESLRDDQHVKLGGVYVVKCYNDSQLHKNSLWVSSEPFNIHEDSLMSVEELSKFDRLIYGVSE